MKDILKTLGLLLVGAGLGIACKEACDDNIAEKKAFEAESQTLINDLDRQNEEELQKIRDEYLKRNSEVLGIFVEHPDCMKKLSEKELDRFKTYIKLEEEEQGYYFERESAFGKASALRSANLYLDLQYTLLNKAVNSNEIKEEEN